MCDITRSNFEEKYPVILESIRHCSFIAFDAEFTVLKANEGCTSSLFDDGAKRYEKFRETARKAPLFNLACLFSRKNLSNTQRKPTTFIYAPVLLGL